MRVKLTQAAFFVLLLAAFSGCGGDSDDSAQRLDPHGCKLAEMPPSRTVDLDPPTEKLSRTGSYVVRFTTNCGEFVVTLDNKRNPITASSFAYMVKNGVYNNTWFHRIISDFVVQGGDPTGDGSGDAGFTVVEPPNGKYRVGTVAMAKAGNELSGASGSQFYIVIGANGADLPPDYAIAGQVTDGWDVVTKIAEYAPADTTQSAKPADIPLIEKAELIGG